MKNYFSCCTELLLYLCNWSFLVLNDRPKIRSDNSFSETIRVAVELKITIYENSNRRRLNNLNFVARVVLQSTFSINCVSIIQWKACEGLLLMGLQFRRMINLYSRRCFNFELSNENRLVGSSSVQSKHLGTIHKLSHAKRRGLVVQNLQFLRDIIYGWSLSTGRRRNVNRMN